jgi:hypothetical protein
MPSRVTLTGDDDQAATIWSEGYSLVPHACTNFYRSKLIEGAFYKQCPTGQSGTGAFYTVPKGKFLSTVSQEAADTLALEYFNREGQAAVDEVGACLLGDFNEIFTSILAVVNWDWITDKTDDTVFPFYSRPLGTGNYVTLPLCNITKFSGLDGTSLNGNTTVPFDIHDVHGLIHFPFEFVHQERDDLLLAWFATVGQVAPNLIPFQTYGGFLIADFNSPEIFGGLMDDLSLQPEWPEPGYDVENDPLNPNQIEITPWKLGGMLGIVETAASFGDTFSADGDPLLDGHFNGYIISYKGAGVLISKWSDMLGDYETIHTIPFNMQGKTTYFGYGIRYDRGDWVAEIYINGNYQYSLVDPSITSFTMFRYQRNVLSMDYWFGDVFIASMSPFTNRVPPVLTARYYSASACESYVNPAQSNMVPLVPVGADTLLECVSDNNILLRAVRQETSARYDGVITGKRTFPIDLRWDLTNEPTLQERLYGTSPLVVSRINYLEVATFLYGKNRQFRNGFFNDNLWDSYTHPTSLHPLLPYGPNFDNPLNYWDSGFLIDTPNQCKQPFPYARFPDADAVLLNDLWPCQMMIPFPFQGAMYTKSYLLDKWYQLIQYPQFGNTLKVYQETAAVKMASGQRGKRTKEVLVRSDYLIPECVPQVSCSTDGVLIGVMGFSGTLLNANGGDGTVCDNLFDPDTGLAECETRRQIIGWNFAVTVQDVRFGDFAREVYVTFTSQITNVVYYPPTLNRVAKPTLYMRVWRDAWQLPIFEETLLLVDEDYDYGGPPPTGLCTFPSQYSMTYKYTTLSDLSLTIDGNIPLFGDPTGGSFECQFFAEKPEGV